MIKVALHQETSEKVLMWYQDARSYEVGPILCTTTAKSGYADVEIIVRLHSPEIVRQCLYGIRNWELTSNATLVGVSLNGEILAQTRKDQHSNIRIPLDPKSDSDSFQMFFAGEGQL